MKKCNEAAGELRGERGWRQNMKMTHPATLRLAYLQRLAALLGKPFIRPQGQIHFLDLIMATMEHFLLLCAKCFMCISLHP